MMKTKITKIIQQSNIYLTNRLHLTVVCSVIDTQYDVICGKNKKVSTSRFLYKKIEKIPEFNR